MDRSTGSLRLVAGAVVLVVLLLAVSAGYAAGRTGSKYSGPAVVANSGQVTGSVSCSSHEEEPASTAAGISVWIKGTAFTAHTDDSGRFVMDYVPAGSYELAVITSGRMIRAEVPVTVPPRTSVDAGAIQVTGGCEGCGGEGGGGGGGGGDCEE